MPVKFACAHCGKETERHTGQYNRAVALGKPQYCGRECMADAKRTGRKALGWHAARFIADDRKTRVECAECGRDMWLPSSKAGLYLRCSPECNAAFRKRNADQRKRKCETCGEDFIPRPRQLAVGHGRFCSQKCNTALRDAAFTDEANRKRAETRRRLIDAGMFEHLKGPGNPRWNGGAKACRARLQESGKLAEWTRAYRKANPDKVREFNKNRNNRMTGRLPRGTVKRIGELQKWKCAICRKGIKKHYHVDHIIPLARGGEHAPHNIQLCCPTCNVRKSAKDPIEYMQSIGRLL